jgi:hypothetical protein
VYRHLTESFWFTMRHLWWVSHTWSRA